MAINSLASRSSQRLYDQAIYQFIGRPARKPALGSAYRRQSNGRFSLLYFD